MSKLRRKTWEDFRAAGVLWFINRILHTVGWAIVLEIADDEIVDAYPARVPWRGFPEASEARGFQRLHQHLAETMPEILSETEQE